MARDRSLILAWAIVLAVVALTAQSARLTIERQDDRLHLSAPHFHFLEGRPLERLHNGAAVTYMFTVTIEPARDARRSVLRHRFVVSYDLWEEKFAVVRDGQQPASASHLTASAVEAWCLDGLLPGVSAAPADRPFVVKLDCGVVPDDDRQPDEGLTLSAVIEFFSRKKAAPPPRWELTSARLRLADVKEKARH
jgi:hypothetical protein